MTMDIFVCAILCHCERSEAIKRIECLIRRCLLSLREALASWQSTVSGFLACWLPRSHVVLARNDKKRCFAGAQHDNPPPYPLRKGGGIRQNPQKKRAQSYGEAIAQPRFEDCNPLISYCSLILTSQPQRTAAMFEP